MLSILWRQLDTENGLGEMKDQSYELNKKKKLKVNQLAKNNLEQRMPHLIEDFRVCHPRFHSKLSIQCYSIRSQIFLFVLFPAQKQKHEAKIRHHFPIQQSLCWTLWSLPSNQERVTLATKLLTHSISSPLFHQCSVITECSPRRAQAWAVWS
jgi:hypothetical protein